MKNEDLWELGGHDAEHGTQDPMKVTVRNVYGRELIYPACDRTEAIAKIAGIKTLQPKHLEIMRDAFGIDTITVTKSSWEGLTNDK